MGKLAVRDSLAPGDGPREALLRGGPEQMTDEELLAIILGTGRARLPVTLLAARLLRQFGSLRALQQTASDDLLQFNGLGPAKVARICAAFSLGLRVLRPTTRVTAIRNSADVFHRCWRLSLLEHERVLTLSLNAQNQIIREECVARGGVDGCQLPIREVFTGPVRVAATGVILVHNHPSGNPTPSAEDRRLTAGLAKVGKLLGIALVDHVIIAGEDYYSFKDAGLL